MEKDNEIRYSDRNNEVNEADMVKEEVAYGVKRQGEYTLEDCYAIPDKLRKYKEAGVKEYWMVDPDKKKVVAYDWTRSESCISI